MNNLNLLIKQFIDNQPYFDIFTSDLCNTSIVQNVFCLYF